MQRRLSFVSRWSVALALAVAPACALAAQPGRGLPMAVWFALLLPMMALGLGLHAVVAMAIKGMLRRFKPLANTEPEIAGYDRSVYHSSDPVMLTVVAIAALGGVGLWYGGYAVSESGWYAGGALVWLAVAVDLWFWQRVTVSAEYVWFKRGLRGRVHQVHIENVRDAHVEEEEAGGLSLRGTRNTTVRLKLRMRDRHVAALPKTDARGGGREAVAQVAQLVGERIARAKAAKPVRNEDQTIQLQLLKLARKAREQSTGHNATDAARHRHRPT
jgi:hypothetical protein